MIRIQAIVLLQVLLVPIFSAIALEPAPKGTFSIVVLPDTQGYMSAGNKATAGSPGPVTNPVFEAHTRWIADNIEAQRIVFVSHVGDIVDKNVDAQWAVAKEHMDRLHGRIPYGIVVGNHDMSTDGDSSLFQQYFPASRFEGFAWYGGYYPGDPERPGHSGNNANSYQLFSGGGIDFIILHLECNAPDDVLAWAESVFAGHRDRVALVTTHMDLGPLNKPANHEGYINDPKGRMQWLKCHGERGNTPQQLWDKFHSKQPNLLMIFSGDQSRTSAMYLPLPGEQGNTVHALLSDYTSSGPLRIYRFNPAAGEIAVITYDTSKDEVIADSTYVKGRENHQFVLKHDFGR
jgi:hypothetical protein